MGFGDNLAIKIRERGDREPNGYSVRKLAAVWRPANPESGRRNLHKYLRGAEPTARVAAEIAAALEVPVEELTGTESADEEDASAMVHRLLLEVQALTAKIEKSERRKKAAA